MPNADEVNARYVRARAHRHKRTGCVFMLAGLIGSLVMGTLFVIFVMEGVISLTLLSFVSVCLVAFIAGLNGWRRGENAMKAIDENIGGLF